MDAKVNYKFFSIALEPRRRCVVRTTNFSDWCVGLVTTTVLLFSLVFSRKESALVIFVFHREMREKSITFFVSICGGHDGIFEYHFDSHASKVRLIFPQLRKVSRQILYSFSQTNTVEAV